MDENFNYANFGWPLLGGQKNNNKKQPKTKILRATWAPGIIKLRILFFCSQNFARPSGPSLDPPGSLYSDHKMIEIVGQDKSQRWSNFLCKVYQSRRWRGSYRTWRSLRLGASLGPH